MTTTNAKACDERVVWISMEIPVPESTLQAMRDAAGKLADEKSLMRYLEAKKKVSDWTELLNPHCDCGEGEDVIAFSHYGSGFGWSGKACRKCMVFMGPRDPEGA